MTVAGFTLEWGGGIDPERMAVAFERLGVDFTRWGQFLFPRVIDELEHLTAQQFGSQGAAGRSAWAQLTADYAAWKEEHYPGKPILQLSGTMFEALTSKSSTHARRDFTDESMDFGTLGVNYASFHQTGTSRMVPRMPFDFGPEAERAITRVAADVVREMAKAQQLEVTE